MSSLDFDSIGFDEAQKLKSDLLGMFESPGWSFVQAFLQERVIGRERALIESCPETVEQMVRFARIKGGVEELKLLPTMLEQVLSDLTEEIRRRQDEMETEDGGQDDN